MKNRFLVLLTAFLLCTVTSSLAQGIIFFDGDMEAALVKAKETNKLVFVDFYADWCAPCKGLAANVFTQDKIGAYFNDKFISVKVDTEAASNKKMCKGYKITSLPTLMFLDADGKVISRLTGSMPADNLLNAAKIATGDELSFLALYDKYKASNNDLVLMQKVMLGAAGYVSTLEGMEREKWIIRINKFYKEYLDLKMGDSLINKQDYILITKFYEPEPKGDKLVEFINKNMDKYIKAMGSAPTYYVTEYHAKVLSALARTGSEEYNAELERINGDMKLAYDAVMGGGYITPYELNKYMYDGEHLLFFKKDVEAYVDLMGKYFDARGDKIMATTCAGAAQKIYMATGGKVSNEIHQKAIEWMVRSLQMEMPLMERVNIIVMIGDSHRDMKNFAEAKKFYNQAYMEAMQITQDMSKGYVQMTITKKIAALDLLKK